MRGTPLVVNKALHQPIMILGVEKRLMLLNALISFPLVAAAHFLLPASLIGVVFFAVMHVVLIQVTRFDPIAATLFKRATRYVFHPYFCAHGDLLRTTSFINTVSRPRS